MTGKSAIEWTDATWNPVQGCTRVSKGCRNCYAERMAARFSGPGLPYHRLAVLGPSGARWTGKVQIVEKVLNQPLRWRKPRIICVNSMSDLCHDGVSEKDIDRICDVMQRAPHHCCQVLTKRAARLAQISASLPWPPNIWMGVSVENADYADRIDHLRTTGAAVTFLSLEPLLGPLPHLDLAGIDWTIVGGESGPGARPMSPDWVRDIRDQCLARGVPF